MRIAVYGVGGVGGYFGGRLARAGVDVTFVARGAHLQALRKNGLRVTSVHGDFEVPNPTVVDDPAAVGPVDYVLVTVKSPQTPEVASRLGASSIMRPASCRARRSRPEARRAAEATRRARARA